MNKNFAIAGIAAALLCGCEAVAAAVAVESYPSKPVRIIVSQGIGGSVDVQTRLFATKLAESFGRAFVVDTRPGRDIAWLLVAKAAPDGYTLLAVAPDFTSAPALYRKPAVDPIRDFAPISLTSQAPFILSVNPALPVKSVQELIGLANERPGKLDFGGGLPGTGVHLITLWFFSATKIKAAFVAYKGVAQALIDVVGGQIHCGFSTGSGIAHIKAGRLRALGTTLNHRSKFLPEVPTIMEQGVAGFEASTFHGLAAPAHTPPAIIDKLSAELMKIAKLPEIANSLSGDNSEPVGSTPDQFRRFIAAEVPRWRKVVEEANLKLD